MMNRERDARRLKTLIRGDSKVSGRWVSGIGGMGKLTSKRKGIFVLQAREMTDEQNQFINHKPC